MTLDELNATTETSSNSHSEKIVDGYTWGHELFGDMHSCAMSSSVSNVHRDSLIQRDRSKLYCLQIFFKTIILILIDSIWPCWSVRDASTMTDDLVSVSPTKVGAIVDSNGDTAPMYLMGYFEGEPVYRTTFSLTNGNDDFLSYLYFFKILFRSRRQGAWLLPIAMVSTFS